MTSRWQGTSLSLSRRVLDVFVVEEILGADLISF
jgi:hypothetical protein